VNDPKQTTVVITADNHTHAGKPVTKGEQITVDEHTAKWLIANNVAKAVAADAAPKKEAK
jgi:predicted neutral ceramidase superfamily lipid hydrolase